MSRQPIKHGDYEIPFDCRFAYWTLLGHFGQTPESARTGKFRNIDLSTVSGKSSVPRKLRKMMEKHSPCEGLVEFEKVPGKNYRLYWIPTKHLAAPKPEFFLKEVVRNGLNHAPVTTGSDGMLFSMPAKGRPV